MTDQVRKELGQQAYQLAYTYDLEFGACPQCVLAAISETIGVVDEHLIKAAHTLSGGGGLRGVGTCGALAGGLLAIGMKYGRERKNFGKTRNLKSFQLSKELMDKFYNLYGGYSCNHIQEKYTGKTYNLLNQEEIKTFKSTCCKEECAKLSGNIAQWVVEMIAE